ncbi:DNA methyltransferase [Flexistipes sinusarabici]|uniref:Site-specific DNA-methyltransferase n=1 Tax=Flexistipes sinusarabici TaxID=2352 RepID=A0A5D0MM27_FLESI|nr:DNA methyltransferase [Flexistipes sinusarabici]TYB34714.1 MAG: site-specific DNA-methyltransferase [Flexistipes sinusarabici]
MSELLTIKEASIWASNYLNKPVTASNISYLIQYGRVRKVGKNGHTYIDLDDLKKYYQQNSGKKEVDWKKMLGDDLNWHLSFADYKESETTKHVHRLHPYKGKFIPQLVEYFLDGHTDEFKKDVYFKKGDIVLDPFCGSGTTLVQANELGLHAVGVDVSAFNSLISNIKTSRHDLVDIKKSVRDITIRLKSFIDGRNNLEFEEKLLEELKIFNDKYFPSPDYKRWVRQGEINEKEYSREKAEIFLDKYYELVKKYNIQLRQEKDDTFIDKWFLKPVREEIDFVFEELKKIENPDTKKILCVMLSRTIRSCRATTHSDLGTLKEPVTTTYYCKKHGKICKPLFTILTWWERYTKDTLKRIMEFEKLKTDTHQYCIAGDSRSVDLVERLYKKKPALAELVRDKRIKGIFSSPPYVGLIDYHEQHAYAYDLFGFERKDEEEIGPLFRGGGAEARESYVNGISSVLKNCKKYLQDDYDVFLVANDKFNLYPKIAEKAGMKICNKFKRPVLNRVEKNRSAYAEIIFHMKEK